MNQMIWNITHSSIMVYIVNVISEASTFWNALTDDVFSV